MVHIHFVGIGGSGLSAIARVLLEQGYTVSGSDRTPSPLVDELRAAGITVHIGHHPSYIDGADLVVRSSAVPDDNPEVVAAHLQGLPVLKRSQFMAEVLAEKQVIAIAGTHGKTTTTAMIAWMLYQAGEDPSYIIGGISKNLKTNAHAGNGKFFVIEADEYDRMFLGLNPSWAIITHLEHDHPDCYPTAGEYCQAFVDFVSTMKPGGALFYNANVPGTAAVITNLPKGIQAYSYGTGDNAVYYASKLRTNDRGGFSFDAIYAPQRETPEWLASVNLQVPGEHNALNALAALSLAHRLGLSCQSAASALDSFSGTSRRFEIIGEIAGITMVSDYGHHPTEIQATLAAARARYPQAHIWAVWQPHTYSRTLALLPNFATAFSNADRVLVTPIYAARETLATITSAEVAASISSPKAIATSSLAATSEALARQVQPGDIIILFSAGDAEQIFDCLQSSLKEKTA
ncbi:MAG TPA: UDP-N-acetylmuramate--L-alanine ligase [Anaerolineaceae bacterium]